MRLIRTLALLTVLIGLVGTPLIYSARMTDRLRNFRVLVPERVYRSGQPNSAALKDTLEDFGIRTVICLRDLKRPDKQRFDDFEKADVEARGLKFVQLFPQPWLPGEDGQVPVQQNVDEFLKVMDDPANYPVWIHCFAGIHRTGAYCAIYRMEYQGWTNQQALEELQNLGYTKLFEEKDVSEYLKNYVPRRQQKK